MAFCFGNNITFNVATVSLSLRVQCVAMRAIPEALSVSQIRAVVLDIIHLSLPKDFEACNHLPRIKAQVNAHAVDTARDEGVLENGLNPGKRPLVDRYRDAREQELGRSLVESPACEARGFNRLESSGVLISMITSPVESVLTIVHRDRAAEVGHDLAEELRREVFDCHCRARVAGCRRDLVLLFFVTVCAPRFTGNKGINATGQTLDVSVGSRQKACSQDYPAGPAKAWLYRGNIKPRSKPASINKGFGTELELTQRYPSGNK